MTIPVRLWLCFGMLTQCAVAQSLPPDIAAVMGRDLPRLLGTPPVQISAVARRADALAPVHVQIDQRVRDAKGELRYVFDAGDDTPRPPHSGLAADDLLLLMPGEAGERVEPAPDGSTEIEVASPGDGRSHWFYVRRAPSAPLAPLIRYDAATDRIVGLDYAIGFGHHVTAVMQSLVLGDPARATNILDRNKARLDVDLAGISTVRRTEDDVRVRTTGMHAGPLRIIRESEVRGRLLLGIYSPPVRDNFIFYPHGFVLPTTIRLTRTARLLARAVTLRISMDLAEPARGMTFLSAPEISAPITIDGHGGQRGGAQPISWYLLRRGDTGLLGWLEAADIAGQVTLYYRDDRTHVDPPEGAAGELGDHGFLFHHAGPLPPGDIRLSSYGWVLHGAQLDRPGDTLRMFASRPRVRVH